MTPAEQEQFDLDILRVMDVNRTRFGLTPDNIRVFLTGKGHHGVLAELVQERVEYLTSKGLCEEAMKDINKANRCWRITVRGIDYVDRHG